MKKFHLATLLPLALLLAAPLQVSAQSPSDGPRQLSEAEQAKIRESMAKGKQRRAQELRQAEQMRQAEQARQQEAQRLAAIEAQRVADEEAEEEAASANSGGTGGAMLHGLQTLQSELDKNQAERRQQQAFLDDLARQKAEAERQRERERRREADERQRSQAQLLAQQQAQQQALAEQAQAQARAQQQSAQARGSAGAATNAPSQPSAQQLAQEQRERQLREAAAKERQRLAQQQQRPQDPALPKPKECTKVQPKFETAFDTVRGEAIGLAGARKKAGEYCSARTGNASFSTSRESCTADGPHILNCSVSGQCSGLMSVTCSNSQ